MIVTPQRSKSKVRVEEEESSEEDLFPESGGDEEEDEGEEEEEAEGKRRSWNVCMGNTYVCLQKTRRGGWAGLCRVGGGRV